MGRWSLERRAQPARRSSVTRTNQTTPQPLTPAEIQARRLELAQDIILLVLRDGPALAPPVQEVLQGLYEALDVAQRQTRRSP